MVQIKRMKKTEKLCRQICFKIFSKVEFGAIVIKDSHGTFKFGYNNKANKPIAIHIREPRVYKTLLLGGTVGAGKGYIDQDWDTDNLQGLIQLFLQNKSLLNHLDGYFSQFSRLCTAVVYKLTLNTERRAKNNILAHYDLGNEFFKHILDPQMMYSCAIYEPRGIDLGEAELKKIQKICSQLDLKTNHHILEIGTGWGGFALYVAQTYGCKVTTTTISNQQYAFVKNKIQQLGLEHQIELMNCDYRKLTGQYDRLVSIEMIEAVGHQYLDTFFYHCNHLVKSGGLLLLQAIVINDQAYERAKNEVDFIKKYIFPGGCLPSVYSISRSISSQTTMQLNSFEDIGQHYVTTLNDWKKNLLSNSEAIIAQGFSESFIRMWKFYFDYCAGGFITQYITAIQALWKKRSTP